MSTVTSADGTIIDYDAYGNGPTVIFIGGASQHRAIDQRTTEIAKQLAAEGFTAVDYDRRGRDRSGDTPPWSLGREVEDVAALIEAAGAPAALYTSSSGAGIALAAVTAGLDVSALALYEPPYFAGSDGTEHIATLERMLNAGQLDEATRYNMTAIIGLPAEAVEEMAQAPWWPGLVAVAPTLVYDHKASHDIETDPDWRSRWAAVTVPTVVYSGDQTFPGLPEAADAVAVPVHGGDVRSDVGGPQELDAPLVEDAEPLLVPGRRPGGRRGLGEGGRRAAPSLLDELEAPRDPAADAMGRAHPERPVAGRQDRADLVGPQREERVELLRAAETHAVEAYQPLGGRSDPQVAVGRLRYGRDGPGGRAVSRPPRGRG